MKKYEMMQKEERQFFLKRLMEQNHKFKLFKVVKMKLFITILKILELKAYLILT